MLETRWMDAELSVLKTSRCERLFIVGVYSAASTFTAGRVEPGIVTRIFALLCETDLLVRN